MQDLFLNPDLTVLTNAQFRELIKGLTATITVQENTDAGLASYWTAFMNACDNFDAAYLKNRDFIDTPAVEAKVKELDTVVAEITMAVRTYQNDEGDMKAAADRLEFYVKNYYKFNKLDYWSRSGKATELAHMLTQHAADVATLHLTPIVTRLNTKISEFDTLYYARETEIDNQKSGKKAKEMKRAAIVAFNQWKHAAQTLYEANEMQSTPDTSKRTLFETISQKAHAWLEGVDRLLSQLGKNKSAGSYHPKPDGPNGPSTDPNRPEGPEPNPGGGSDNGNGGNSGGNSGGNGGADKPPNPEERKAQLAALEQKVADEIAAISALYHAEGEVEEQLSDAIKARAEAKVVDALTAKRAALQKELAEKLEIHQATMAEYQALLDAKKKWDDEHGDGKK